MGDLPFRAGDEVYALVNDLGSTNQMELLIVNRRLHQVLAEFGIKVHETLSAAIALARSWPVFPSPCSSSTPS